MKTNFFKSFIIICVVLALSSPAWSISLSFSPSYSIGDVGDIFNIDVVIGGLQNRNLAAFDFNINYNPNILSFNSYTLGVGLGDTSIFDNEGYAVEAEDWSKVNFANGIINLAELSWLSNFSFQSDSFVLATLSFIGNEEGISPLSFSDVSLVGGSGGLLSAMLNDGDVAVVTPEPATMALLGIGLIGVAVLRKKFGK